MYSALRTIEKKNLRDRSRRLASNAKELGLAKQQAQEYEQLDVTRKKGVYEAQQRCRKFRTGEKDWSPKTTLLGIRALFGSWHAIGHMGPRFKDGIMQD
jgi:hypothetical protein